MINTNKKLILPIVLVGATGIVGLTVLGVPNVNAQTTNPFSGLAQAIAQKFNLNQTDVQDEINSYMQTQKQNMLKGRLDKLVSAGKITGNEETAILNELATKPKPSDFQAWLKSQNIDPKTIGFGGFRMWRGHFKGTKPLVSPTPTPTP